MMEDVVVESTTSVHWWTYWRAPWGTKAKRSKRKKIHVLVRSSRRWWQRKTLLLRFVLSLGFLVKDRNNTNIGKGKNHPMKSSLACDVWKCTNTNLGNCSVGKWSYGETRWFIEMQRRAFMCQAQWWLHASNEREEKDACGVQLCCESLHWSGLGKIADF